MIIWILRNILQISSASGSMVFAAEYPWYSIFIESSGQGNIFGVVLYIFRHLEIQNSSVISDFRQ